MIHTASAIAAAATIHGRSDLPMGVGLRGMKQAFRFVAPRFVIQVTFARYSRSNARAKNSIFRRATSTRCLGSRGTCGERGYVTIVTSTPSSFSMR